MGHATSSTDRTKSTGVGIEALDAVGNGDGNTAFGYRALTANTTGYSNTSVGNEALRDVVGGFRNTAIGIKALEQTVEGSENIAIGRKSMNGLLTAQKNIAIGNEAAASSTTAVNQIIIGHQATGQGNNYAVIGNADVTRVYAAQDEGATLYAAGMESSAGSISIASTLADGQTLKLGKNGAVEMIISPHGTPANETFSLTNTSGTAESAIALTSTAGGVDVNAAAAKDVNITGGQVALLSLDNTASAISLTANQGTSETIVITTTQGTSSSAVDINANAGGVAIDAGAAISIDAGAASNLTTSAGALTIDGAAGVNLAGNSSEIDVTTSGTVDINSATLDIDASGAITIDGSSVSIEGLTYPASDGTNGQFLTTNGSGTLSWATESSGGATSINGLSDALVESNSIWLGNDPSSSTNTANTSIGIGTTALDQVTTGDDNVAVGYNALTSITDSHRNVAVGKGALSNTTASNNVAVGNDAGNLITTGSSNTYLGYNSDGSANSVSNETALGANAVGQGTNTVTIGDDNVTAVYLSEDKGATVYAGALDVIASAGITLQNDETITNSTDGTIEIGGSLSGTGTISGFDANLNDQTGTTYTLVAGDNGKVVTLNNGSAITLTIPASLGDGFNCLIVQKGTGQVTLSAASGVSIANRSTETKTAGQYATVSVINIGNDGSNDIYILSGDTGS